MIIQAGAIEPVALPTGPGHPLLVAVGAPAALPPFDGKVAFTAAIPFDPGVMVQEIIAHLEDRIP